VGANRPWTATARWRDEDSAAGGSEDGIIIKAPLLANSAALATRAPR